MFRIRRVPGALDQFFRTLQPRFHWDHWTYCRLLVLVIAVMWGRRNVANLYRYLEATHHRTRFNNFCLVAGWDPEAGLRQKAQELLRTLHPQRGEAIYLILDASKQAKRGQHMDAVTKRKDPTTEAYIRGHQYVCAMLVCRDHVLPWGIRLYIKEEPCRGLARPFHKTTELAG
ncbi:MAG TPA: hypothetical protein VLK82_05285 [Candidatus Tectomicrobia bacterium]|nr:hypothetical protein [Candidatus Tectomicrobia bacterium]